MNKYLIGISIVCIISAYYLGKHDVQLRWELDKETRERQYAKELEDKTAKTTLIEKGYLDAINKIRSQVAKSTEIVKYISPIADTSCSIPVGFNILLNSAAGAYDMSPTAEALNAAPSTTTLSAIASTAVENYTRCNENARQLTALQEYVLSICPVGD